MKKEFDLPLDVIQMLQKLAQYNKTSESDIVSALILVSFMQLKKMKKVK